jgi:hypothetical protein
MLPQQTFTPRQQEIMAEIETAFVEAFKEYEERWQTSPVWMAKKFLLWMTSRLRELAKMLADFKAESDKCCDRLGDDCDGFFGCNKPDEKEAQ